MPSHAGHHGPCKQPFVYVIHLTGASETRTRDLLHAMQSRTPRKKLGKAFIYRLYTTFAYLASGCKEPHS